MNKPEVIIYTDGSSKGNPGPGGYGLVMEWSGRGIFKQFSQGYRLTTNNRMELMGVIVGLEKLKYEGLAVLVVSDSKYVIDSVTKGWVFNWENRSFIGKKNADLWERFLICYRKHLVCFEWVKGHNNHPMNERCDRLAVQSSDRGKLLIDSFYEKNR